MIKTEPFVRDTFHQCTYLPLVMIKIQFNMAEHYEHMRDNESVGNTSALLPVRPVLPCFKGEGVSTLLN